MGAGWTELRCASLSSHGLYCGTRSPPEAVLQTWGRLDWLWKGCLSSSSLLSEGVRALVAGSYVKGGPRGALQSPSITADGSEIASFGRGATGRRGPQQRVINGTHPALWEMAILTLGAQRPASTERIVTVGGCLASLVNSALRSYRGELAIFRAIARNLPEFHMVFSVANGT